VLTKVGNTLLLDRDFGKPIFGYRLRRAPVSRVPGEQTAEYQPVFTLPEPFTNHAFTADQITDVTDSANRTVTRKLRGATYGFFEPPVIGGRIAYYGIHGGAEWPGGAVDPTRGTFLLALLGIYVGAAFALFALRTAALKEGPPFELVSREAALVVNNLLLTVILGIVFFGTLYPLFVEAATGDQLSVGPPYFNTVAGPMALILAALVAVGPLLAWRREKRPVFKRLSVPALLAATALVISLFAAPQIGWLPRLGLTIAAWLAPASLIPLVGRNPWRTPLATWGMAIAHFGVAVAIAGMACDSAFTKEKLAVARPGETLSVGPWLVRLQDVTPAVGPNWTAVEAELRASRGGGVRVLKPQTRYFTDPATETNEAAIETMLGGQLYTVIGKPDGDGRWQLRLWWKPMVTLIWLGGALIALGGLLAMIGRAWRTWRKERDL
jgi:cytochrome c-type biogenesis protein CcmF